MNSTVIKQPTTRVIVAKSASFPDGNGAAFNALETRLKTLKGRKFYGLVYPAKDGLDYYAGLVPDNEIEESRFAELGFPIRMIDGGRCARVKLMNWMTKTDQIAPVINALIEQYGIDRSRPQMEYYRSHSELHLLVPIP